ncbi:hypothetical protein [Neorhizobium sp. S3-V5DH]|uniref:hypothetical protein n=1 Tax=Neorhizobium sp. S3-V5DH TaxID=2485166 RepID=UPI001048BE3D|nr:hypothetical protein [Neorhizobium sp. S3-V5DH]TCV75920.1 hypothetical protein EDE09_101203 [Neorhizobium sp. S3-V5DH]
MNTFSTAPTVQNSRNVSLPHVSIISGPRPNVKVEKSKSTPAPKVEPPGNPNVLLVGLDDQGRPHASWFGEDDGDAAAVAADLMDMAIIEVSNEELAAIAKALPRGKLFGSGKAFVPFVKRTVYDQLATYLDDDYLAAAAARVEAVATAAGSAGEGYAKASKGEVPPRKPEDWSKIAVGDLVLATDDPEEGWFDAIVIEQAGEDRFRLRWSDWPDLPTFTRGVTEIALLHPSYVAA